MADAPPTKRPGGRSARTRARVHQAAAELLAERGPEGVSVAEVAERAGVNPTSIYRRWHTREGLLADVAIARLETDMPLPDQGDLRADLTAWATAAAEHMRRPEGRAFLLVLLQSWPTTPTAEAERNQQLLRRAHGLERILRRAAERGEKPPDSLLVVDTILAPIYLRALWSVIPAGPGYPRVLVDRLLGPRPEPQSSDGAET